VSRERPRRHRQASRRWAWRGAAAYSDEKGCESQRGGFRVGEIAHAAASRRPPIPLSTIVARTNMYTYDANVWGLSIVQGPFSVAPRQTPDVAIRNRVFSPHGLYGALTWRGEEMGHWPLVSRRAFCAT
jgi:hypothetical protein